MHRMEFRIYGSDRKALMFSDEVLLPTDALIHTKDIWDLKNTCNYQEPLLIPSPEIAENQGLMEPGFHGSLRTTPTDKPMGYSMGSNISDGRTVTSISCQLGQKELFREEELGSKDSISVIDACSQNSSFIDLKLGRLSESKDVKNNKSPRDTRRSLSVPSTVAAKKIRSIGLNGQIPFCQVHGCNMDLSSSKDYHKKHKVCDIHSKTAKVIVNGIEQRFCQQCSRFHLLAEFDDGKRSCRRRLAGHNERRRKPQLDIHSGRTGKLLESYYGGRFLDASLPVRTSFLSPEKYPRGILHELEHDNADWCRHINVVDDGFPRNGRTPMSTVNGQLLTKPFLPNYSPEKQFFSIHNMGSPSGNISYEHGDQNFQGYASSGSNIQVCPRVGESICALSLLSSQSQNASGYSSAIPMIQPVIFPDGQAQKSITHFSDKPSLPMISQASTTVASNRFSSGMNSGEEEQMRPLVSGASNAVSFEFQNGAVYQGFQFMSTRESLSPEPGNTVNLIQLSSLLQRAEEQRMLVQAKQEYEALNPPSHHTGVMTVKCAMTCCL